MLTIFDTPHTDFIPILLLSLNYKRHTPNDLENYSSILYSQIFGRWVGDDMGDTAMLAPPYLLPSYVSRPDVYATLDKAAENQFLYLHAPAGFGKSVATAQWLRQKNAPTAWVPLTSYDDSPTIFCRYILKALAVLDEYTSNYIQHILTKPSFDSAPLEHLFQILSQIKGLAKTSYIVLDDFHLINNPVILKAFPQIINKFPASIRCIVISRIPLPLSFSELLLKNQIGIVSEKTLHFQLNHIIKLFKKRGIALDSKSAKILKESSGGWALGLSAYLLSEKHIHTDIPQIDSGHYSQQYIYEYLNSEVWSHWDESTRHFLLKTSVLETLPVDLCKSITSTDAETVLKNLLHESGLLIRLGSDTFRYHQILLDFLRTQAENTCFDLTESYIAAGKNALEAGNFFQALDYFIQSKNTDIIDQCLSGLSDSSITSIGVEDYYLAFVNLIREKLPLEYIENNYLMITDCIWTSYLGGDLEQMLHWMPKLINICAAGQLENPYYYGICILLQYVSPLSDPWKFTIPIQLDSISFNVVPTISLTMNLPYAHRSHRDYSDIVDCWQDFLPKICCNLKTIIGDTANITIDSIAAGILYEQNDLKQAKHYAIKAHAALDDTIHPEIWFSVYAHLAAILFAEGNEAEAEQIIAESNALVKEKNVLYLTANLTAAALNHKLQKGDTAMANEWLESYMSYAPERIPLHQSFQAITTARALIVVGRFTSALLLLEKIIQFAECFHRPLDIIECAILKSIAHWNMKNKNTSLDEMEKAVVLAEKYGYIRLFANEGAEIVPLLQKLLVRAGRGGCTLVKEQTFLRQLMQITYENASAATGLTHALQPNPVKLSPQQKRMLQLLTKNYSHRQICQLTGLKMNTVKAHLYKLYEKLEVSRAADAILMGKKLNLLDTD